MSEQVTPDQVARKAVDAVRIALGVAGLVAIVVGTIILFNPASSGLAMMTIVAVIIAIVALIVGLVYLGTGIFSRTLTGGKRFLRALIGVIYLAAGIVIFVNLGTAAEWLAILVSIVVGISWIVEGVYTFATLGEVSSKAFAVIYAILSIVAGGVLVFSPLLGAATLWLLLGIALVVMGVVQVVRAFTTKAEPTLLVVE